MDIEITATGEISVVRIDGNILHEHVNVFKSVLLDLVNQGKIKMVLDFGSLLYISSLCLAALIEIKKRVNELGGDLKLSHVNNVVQNLLESTTLIRKIEVFPDADAAVKSFGDPSAIPFVQTFRGKVS
jgi:anti-anti-sigma factor